MHKVPSKQRFIAASSRCTTKSSSSAISSCLKLILKAHKIYCDRIKTYTGFNFMWIIQNSMEVHDKLQTKARNISTFDFSTLYTSIPHDKLKNEMAIIIEKAFNGMKKKLIKVYKYEARWTNSQKSENGIYFTCSTLVSMVNWLIDNTYVTIGNKVFKQTVGIPMGTDCAPYLANLFLFSFEFRFMNENLKSKNFDILHKFNRCCRYIDDLLTINNDGLMKDYYKKIYPPELKLSSDDTSDKEANYLDLHLEVKDKKFTYRLYDKRDKFSFPIVNFPNLQGNIPATQSYGVFTSQLVRYTRGCLNYEDFKYRTKILVDKLLKQHFNLRKLVSCFNRFSFKYQYLLRKYSRNLNLLDIIGFNGYF